MNVERRRRYVTVAFVTCGMYPCVVDCVAVRVHGVKGDENRYSSVFSLVGPASTLRLRVAVVYVNGGDLVLVQIVCGV